MNSEHFALLQKGPQAWNDWKKRNPQEIRQNVDAINGSEYGGILGDFRDAKFENVNLSTADFSGSDLAGASFRDVRLSGVTWNFANFRNCYFFNCQIDQGTFTGAIFDGSRFYDVQLGPATLLFNEDKKKLREVGVSFRNVEFQGSEISSFPLKKSILHKASFSDCLFQGIRVTAADLSGAKILRSQIKDSKFADSNFSNSVFDEVFLDKCHFSNCTWKNSETRKLTFIDSEVPSSPRFFVNGEPQNGMRFCPNSSDAWSVLRRSYTGPLFSVWIGATILAFGPLLIEAKFWQLMDEASQLGVPLLSSGAPLVSKSELEDHLVISIVSRWASGWFPFVMTMTILGYNAARAVLTWNLSSLRQEEERSGFSPFRWQYEKYWNAHKILRIIAFMALGFLLWNLGSVFLEPVSYPRSE